MQDTIWGEQLGPSSCINSFTTRMQRTRPISKSKQGQRSGDKQLNVTVLVDTNRTSKSVCIRDATVCCGQQRSDLEKIKRTSVNLSVGMLLNFGSVRTHAKQEHKLPPAFLA